MLKNIFEPIKRLFLIKIYKHNFYWGYTLNEIKLSEKILKEIK